MRTRPKPELRTQVPSGTLKGPVGPVPGEPSDGNPKAGVPYAPPMRPLALLVTAGVLLAGCLGALPGQPEATETAPGPLDLRVSPPDADAMEVDVAADGAHLVAASNLRAEGHSGFGVYVSEDGGRSWDADYFDPEDLTALTGHPVGFAGLSDPVVAIHDGTVYLSGLAYIPTSAVFVAWSQDGGRSWDGASLVDESDVAVAFNDKEWMGVNPATGTIHVAWAKEPVIDSLRAVQGATGLDVDVSDIHVSRSTDGGETWSDPVEVDRGMHNNGTAIAYTDGRVHLIYLNYEEHAIDHLHSDDDGATWSKPRAIASATVVPPYPAYQRMHTLPGLAAGPDGTLAAVWHDGAGGDADVRSVVSGDGGATWSPSFEVGSDADGDREQIYPWVDVGPGGAIHYTYYRSKADDAYTLEYVHRAIRDGVHEVHGKERQDEGRISLRGGSWTQVRPVSNTTFSIEDRSGLLGDYTNVAVGEQGVFPAWADGRHDRPQIHVGRLAGGS